MRDHCPYTVKYRGTAHQKCNFQYAIPHYTPTIFHNLSGYDMHLFIRELGKKFDSGSISVITKNNKKYISFSVNITVNEYVMPLGEIKPILRQLCFIKSFRFMASSLDLLARNLVWMNGMACKQCGSKTELMHINENYVTLGMCRKCQGASY